MNKSSETRHSRFGNWVGLLRRGVAKVEGLGLDSLKAVTWAVTPSQLGILGERGRDGKGQPEARSFSSDVLILIGWR